MSGVATPRAQFIRPVTGNPAPGSVGNRIIGGGDPVVAPVAALRLLLDRLEAASFGLQGPIHYTGDQFQ
jgi:hypothetical protein